MAFKRLTPIEVAEKLAEKTGLPLEQVKAVLTAQAELAYENADHGFAVPGIGVLRAIATAPRTMVMQFGPRKGERIEIPARRSLKFRVSRIAMDMVLASDKPMPDLFKVVPLAEFKFSSEATQLADPSAFLRDVDPVPTTARDGSQSIQAVYQLPNVELPSGRIVACDPLTGGAPRFARSVSPGKYPIALVLAKMGQDERVALAIVRFSDTRVSKWEPAVPEGVDPAAYKPGDRFGYGVDSGTGCICDASIWQLMEEAAQEDTGILEQITEELRGNQWLHIDSPNGSMALFSSGYGDGRYPSYFGLDSSGSPALLLTDFNILKWRGSPG